jgi:sugar O-acyltransferase (sialic acid O-acetyltransferase NeuD family)
MRDLVIYGAGGFGREVLLLIDQINADKKQWNVLGFIDDGKPAHTQVDDHEVLGGANYLQQTTAPLSVVMAIAEPALRRKIVGDLKGASIDFPTLLHPAANLGDRKRNKFQEGSIITAGNILTTSVHVGRFVILNLSCTVGHDVILGDYCTILPGCNISGNVKIGQGTLLGTGSQVLQNLTLGSHCKVGAGAVVTKSFGDDLTVLGIPAREK